MIAYLEFPTWLSPQIAPGVPLRWYGVMYLVAFGVTFLLFRYEARRSGLSTDRDQIAGFFTWAILGALLGGRLFFVLFYGDRTMYLSRPWLIVWPFQEGEFTGIQGMSYHGGLLGAVAAVAAFTRREGLSLLDWGDTLAVSAPLGYAAGRLGNFINGELVGRATTVRWGVLFPQARRYPAAESWAAELARNAGVEMLPEAVMVNLPRHPSQLYEAALEGIALWAILWLVFRRDRPYPGAPIGLYVAGYGVARFMAEYFRATNEAAGFALMLGPATAAAPHLTASAIHFTEGQVISLAMIAAGVALLVVFRLVAPPAVRVDTFADSDD